MKPKKHKRISIDNSVEKMTTAGKLHKFIDMFKGDWHRVIFALTACQVSNTKYNIYGDDICGGFVADLFSACFVENYKGATNVLPIISIRLPKPDMIVNIADLFRPLMPVIPDYKIGTSTIEKANERSSKIEFSDDAKQKMLNICIDLQKFNGFDRTKIIKTIPFLQAIAYIAGHTVVESSDLRFMEMLSTNDADAMAFSGIIDAQINDYNAIAASHRSNVYKAMQTLESASTAIRQVKPINFFDATIDPDSSLDDIIVRTLTITAKSKSEVAALTDGKSKTNIYHKPLFDLLEYLTECDRKVASMKGIR